jgi:hypothetical protein
MLLTMSTATQASRLLLYWVGVQADRARHGIDRETAQSMVDLVTPIAKAWSTDTGFLTASLGIQVLGGAGYVEESGMAQRLRDVRISPIYEGTNGIQAIDLVTRKLGRDGGKWVRLLLDEIATSIPDVGKIDDPLVISIRSLSRALSILRSTTEWMLEELANDRDDAIAGATSYLELFGMTMGGWLMLRRAKFSKRRSQDCESRAIAESNFFALEVLGRSAGLAHPIMAGADHLRISINRPGF